MARSAVIGALRVDLGINTAQFQSGLSGAQTRLDRFGKVLRTGMLAAVAATAAAGTAMTAAFRGFAKDADNVRKTAQAVGTTTEQLSAMRHAAGLAGLSFEKLSTGMRRQAQAMQQAIDSPTGEAARAFDRLGIEVEGADGKLRNSVDVMMDIADEFAGLEDGAAKTAAAMAIFGRAGTEMIPLLNGGAAGMRSAMEEAKAFGLVITDDVARGTEVFNDNLSRLGGMMRGVVNRMSAAAVPAFEALSQRLVDAARGSDLFERTGNALGAMLSGVARLANAAVDGLQKMFVLGDRVQTFANVLSQEVGFADFADAWDAFTKNLALGWDLVVKGWQTVAPILGGVLDGIANTVRATVQIIMALWENLGPAMMDGLISLFNSLSQSIAELLNRAIINPINEVIERLASIGVDLGEKLAPFESIGEIENKWAGAGARLGEAISDALDGALSDRPVTNWLNSVLAKVNAATGAVDRAGAGGRTLPGGAPVPDVQLGGKAVGNPMSALEEQQKATKDRIDALGGNVDALGRPLDDIAASAGWLPQVATGVGTSIPSAVGGVGLDVAARQRGDFDRVVGAIDGLDVSIGRAIGGLGDSILSGSAFLGGGETISGIGLGETGMIQATGAAAGFASFMNNQLLQHMWSQTNEELGARLTHDLGPIMSQWDMSLPDVQEYFSDFDPRLAAIEGIDLSAMERAMSEANQHLGGIERHVAEPCELPMIDLSPVRAAQIASEGFSGGSYGAAGGFDRLAQSVAPSGGGSGGGREVHVHAMVNVQEGAISAQHVNAEEFVAAMNDQAAVALGGRLAEAIRREG